MFIPNHPQIRVLNLLVKGTSNKQMAATLSVSVPTIEYHLHRLFTATDATNRVELAMWWREFLETPFHRHARAS